jgi:hypothetical protein
MVKECKGWVVPQSPAPVEEVERVDNEQMDRL